MTANRAITTASGNSINLHSGCPINSGPLCSYLWHKSHESSLINRDSENLRYLQNIFSCLVLARSGYILASSIINNQITKSLNYKKWN